MSTPTLPAAPQGTFQHEAFFYRDDEEYLAGTVPFIEDGLAAGEAVLVAVPEARLDLLAGGLAHADRAHVRFVAMEELGRNPAWIIPAWREFVVANAASRSGLRGVGEPIWADRSSQELAECGRHEALLNLAFRDADRFRLRCPYDVASLPGTVLGEACRNHPELVGPTGSRRSESFREGIEQWLEAPLPAPPAGVRYERFDRLTLGVVRRRAASSARDAGLVAPRVDDFVLAVSEAVTNSVCHGGGGGRVAFWVATGVLICDVRDSGCIADPLAGRVRPGAHQLHGRGLWLIQQLCDLVQVRREGDEQVVRLRFLL